MNGSTTYNPYKSSVPEFISGYSQAFEFDSDGLGNMTSKVSTETVSPQKSIGDNLNYTFDYKYDAKVGEDNSRLPSGGLFNTTAFNLFNYSNNNPVKYVDPDGRTPGWIRFGKSGFGHEAPQRLAGYYDFYDDLACIIGFDIDGTAFKTDDFVLRLWKGNYGDISEIAKSHGFKKLGKILSLYGGAGGEIGFYNPNNSSMKKSDLSSLGITGTRLEVINNKTGNLIGSRSEKQSFWTTLFSWFDNSHKEDISTRNTIFFENEESATAFMNKLNRDVTKKAENYNHNRNQNFNIRQEENKIIIYWGDKKNE